MPTKKVTKTSIWNRILRGKEKSQKTVLLDVKGYRSEFLKGLTQGCREKGWRILDLSLTIGVIPLKEITAIGVITEGNLEEQNFKTYQELGLPIVRVGSVPHPLDSKIITILANKERSGHKAVQHFLDRNLASVAFVANQNWEMSRTLYEGFALAARENGIPCHFLQFENAFQGSDGFLKQQKQFSDWFSNLPKPVGILRGNDLMTSRLAAMCIASGVVVPEEASLLGYGNIHRTCELSPITLSSIDPGDFKQGKMAVRILQKVLDGEEQTDSTHMAPDQGIIERQSTQVVSVIDPSVAKGVKYIWNNYHRPITIDMIAEHLNVSRRKLERDFQKHLRRGVSEELRRKRLSAVCELLRSTNLTIDDIAEKTGIGETVSLHRAFQKEFNMTPGEFRLLTTR